MSLRRRQFRTLADLPSGHVLNACRGWLAVIRPYARTNLVTNPSGETNTTGYTAAGGSIARSTTEQYHGAYSIAVTPSAGSNSDGVFYGSVSLTSGTTYAYSCKVKGSAGREYTISIATTGGANLTAVTFRATGRWQWVYGFWTETSSTSRRFYIRKNAHSDSNIFYVDGLQIEACGSEGVFPTTYIDGDQPSLLSIGQFPAAYRWNGARHASTSTRDANARDGGRVMNFDFFNLLITGVIGLGIATPSHIVTSQGYSDGASYQTSVVPSRGFRVQARFNTRSAFQLDRARSEFGAAIGLDRASPRQPVALLFQKYRDLTPIGETGKIIASLDQGMEGTQDNTIGEDVDLRFHQWLPFVRGPDEGMAITVSDTIATGANRETFYRNDAGTWSLLDNITTSVNAMARHPDGSIYIVGSFTAYGAVFPAAGTSANRIIRFDPATSAFSALGTGLNGIARAVKIGPSGKVYVCGDFTTAGGTTVNRVAVWDPVASTWAALGSGGTKGVDASALAIDLDSDENLYITGDFVNAGGAAAVRIAKWTNSTNAWSALSTGLNSQGNGIAVGLDDTVYVHGAFTTAGGVSAARIAHWTGSAFEAMGSGVSSQPSNNTLRVDRRTGWVYTGGVFVTAGGLTVNGIAAWNGVTWTALGTGVAGASASVDAIEFGPDGLLYLGGSFTQVNGIVTSDAFAAWNGSSFVLPDLDVPGTANMVCMGFTASGGIVAFFNNSDVGDAKAAHVNTATNHGSAMTYPTVHITGGTSAVRLHQIRSYSTGKILSFDLDIAPAEEIDIISTPFSVQVISWVRGDITTDVLLPGSSVTMPLIAGANSVTVFTTGGTPTVVMYWPKLYADASDLIYQ